MKLQYIILMSLFSIPSVSFANNFDLQYGIVKLNRDKNINEVIEPDIKIIDCHRQKNKNSMIGFIISSNTKFNIHSRNLRFTYSKDNNAVSKYPDIINKKGTNRNQFSSIVRFEFIKPGDEVHFDISVNDEPYTVIKFKFEYCDEEEM